MRKAVKIAFIGVFCAVIGLSFPVFNVFSKRLSMDRHESRLATGLPQVLQSPLRELPRNLDNFLVDNSPFRYQFVLVNAGLDYALFGTSQSDQVLPGRDGWLFYKDGPNAAQPMANYQGLTEENRTDLMAAYLQSHTTVPVVWRYDVLRSQARQNPDRLLYYKTDTHWNAVGALIGLDGIFEALDMPTLPPESYPVDTEGTTTGDMANVAALYASLPAEKRYVVPGYARMFEKDSRAVRVIGDSFSEYYMPYLQARFTNSWREHIDTFTLGVVEHPGCDILILEVNERSLDKLLAILEQF